MSWLPVPAERVRSWHCQAVTEDGRRALDPQKMGRWLWGQAEFTGVCGVELWGSVSTRYKQLQPQVAAAVGAQAPASLQQPASVRKCSCRERPRAPWIQGDLRGRAGVGGGGLYSR